MFFKQIKSEKGTAAIEFAFYMFIFVLMCAFLTDITSSLIKKSEIERVNNSLMMILRDRTSFYADSNIITKLDLDNLSGVAELLLKNEDGSVEPYQLGVREVYFKPKSTQVNKIPSEYNFVSGKINGCDIENNTTPQEKLSALSVWGPKINTDKDEEPFWYSVYEITLCVPGVVSNFRKALGYVNKNLGSIYVKHAGIPRE